MNLHTRSYIFEFDVRLVGPLTEHMLRSKGLDRYLVMRVWSMQELNLQRNNT